MQNVTRRQWLAAAAAGIPGALVWRSAGHGQTVDTARQRRVASVVEEYAAQGYHRTATAVDASSGEWLASRVRETGLTPQLEPFTLDRVDLVTAALVAAGRRLEGIPLFDGAFTDAAGVRGRLGAPETGAAVAVADTSVNGAGAGPLGAARRSGAHQAIVAITRGRRPGLCPSNADAFRTPFGPPVLQVSSDDGAWLRDVAGQGVEAQVIAHVTRARATAHNVVASVEGRDPAAAPVIVMTPRSGWYWCASERGGGIACWLEIMRALRAERPARTVHFVASSGHELGHLGIDAFIAQRPGIVARAIGWLHLGANIGAAVDPGTTLQASHDELDEGLTTRLAADGLTVTQRTPRGRVPNGEAEAVHRGGGRYASVIGGNGLFHHIEDRGPQSIDAAAIARFSVSLTAWVRQLAGRA